MTITLSREQQEWLEAEVAAGRFPSVEDAVRLAIAELMRPSPHNPKHAKAMEIARAGFRQYADTFTALAK